MKNWSSRVNDAVARSIVGRRFRLEGSGHRRERKGARFLTEIRAGLTTFFAMAYIISVNATILTDSGGPCVCTDTKDPTCKTDIDYNLCLNVLKRDQITATAAISALSSFCMGLFSNMPIALAPGMGLNAYFTYTVVGFHGSGPVSYGLALTAVFVEGFIFFALSLFGMRQCAGIGAITGDRDTPVTLGGCVPSEMVDGVCPGGARMRNPTLWVGIFCGGILTCVLMMYRVKGAIIAGILLVSVISWPRPTNVTYFPYSALGNDSFDFFKKVVTFHKIESTLVQQEWDLGQAGGQFGLALITFLYVDILDATGTMYSMARFCGAIDERTQDFEGSAMAYTVDALSISIGSLFGSSPVTAFVESGAGISEGGKTGLTAMTTGVCFFVSIFFSPIFASIPPWATGCTLILVGSMMVRVAADINWRYMGDAIPAFVCLAVMPFTYSIAYGLIAGILTYALLNTLVKVVEVLSCGKIVPENKEFKDPWTYKVPGGVLPGWQRRLARGKRDFWREDEDELGEASAGAGAGAGSESQVELDGVVKGGLRVKPLSASEEFDKLS
ncbi:inner membrane protein yieG [Trichophyton rubrum]|uniref:Inner membrane protein yieG n=1 Tax=Trichophyton rubrum TaxID=5551 RepID=A0A178EUT4_TRIRU|nr:inner membrane protein yieG [Trichophyton rubrum]